MTLNIELQNAQQFWRFDKILYSQGFLSYHIVYKVPYFRIQLRVNTSLHLAGEVASEFGNILS